MVKIPKEASISAKKVELSTLKFELAYKQALLNDFLEFVRGLLELHKANPSLRLIQEMPKEVKSPKGVAEVWEYFDETVLPEELHDAFFSISNRLALLGKIEQILLDEYLDGARIEHLYKKGIISFLKYTTYFSWGLKIRKHYYTVVIKHPEAGVVPTAASGKREPKEFLEDAIADLEDEITLLEKS